MILKHRDLYSKIISNMGGFHQFHVFRSVLFKRYSCKSLQDWFLDSGTVAAGSVSQVLEGRHYRSICPRKRGFDALVQRRVEDITNKFELELIHPDLLSNHSELRHRNSSKNLEYVKSTEEYTNI